MILASPVDQPRAFGQECPRLISLVTYPARLSEPFIILLVAVIPLTRLITGSAIGIAAAIVPLTIAAAP